MSKELLRLPYTASQVTHRDGELMILIYPIAEVLVAERGLSERFASFIEEHCRCRGCGQLLRNMASHQHCSATGTGALWAVTSPPLHGWAWALFKAELAHRLKFELQQPAYGQGAHSPQALSGLLHAQAGRCFHCLHALLDAGTHQFHYAMSCAPELRAGDDTDGTVLVCAACSQHHGDMLVALHKIDEEPDAVLRQAHKAMHARVRQFKRGPTRGGGILGPLLQERAIMPCSEAA